MWLGWVPTTFSNVPIYQGSLDGANCTLVGGWAWNAAAPNESQALDLSLDGSTTMIIAKDFRPDLPAAGIGDGHHAFTVVSPVPHDGKPHTVRVTFDRTLIDVPGSPKTVTCAP